MERDRDDEESSGVEEGGRFGAARKRTRRREAWHDRVSRKRVEQVVFGWGRWQCNLPPQPSSLSSSDVEDQRQSGAVAQGEETPGISLQRLQDSTAPLRALAKALGCESTAHPSTASPDSPPPYLPFALPLLSHKRVTQVASGATHHISLGCTCGCAGFRDAHAAFDYVFPAVASPLLCDFRVRLASLCGFVPCSCAR